MPKAMKWVNGATPEEIKRVETIDTALTVLTTLNKRAATKVARLKTERTRIILRCNVRAWRRQQ